MLAVRRMPGNVGPLWYRESANNLTWELSAPRLVAIEHAEQSRANEAPPGAGDTTGGGEAMERLIERVGGLDATSRRWRPACECRARRGPASSTCGSNRPFSTALNPFVCNRYEIAEFGKEAFALGVSYLGVCCGAGPHPIRSLAEALGRRPPASRYSADMSKHAFFGQERVKTVYKEMAEWL